MVIIQSKTIGEVWIKLVKYIISNGLSIPDEKRGRLAIQNIHLKADIQDLNDEIILRYGNKENIDQLLDMTFGKEEMHDFDVVPSFSDGAKSYFARLKESNFIEFAIDRLIKIPESKKVVMVYPEWNDYKKVMANHFDDYLPCIVSVQLRMLENKDGSWTMNTIFFARSADAYQKFNANMMAMTKLTQIVAEKVAEGLKKKIHIGFLEGLISDCHIYSETFKEASEMLKKYEEYQG